MDILRLRSADRAGRAVTAEDDGLALLFAELPTKPIEVSPLAGMVPLCDMLVAGTALPVLRHLSDVSIMNRFTVVLRTGYDSARIRVKMMVDVLGALTVPACAPLVTTNGHCGDIAVAVHPTGRSSRLRSGCGNTGHVVGGDALVQLTPGRRRRGHPGGTDQARAGAGLAVARRRHWPG